MCPELWLDTGHKSKEVSESGHNSIHIQVGMIAEILKLRSMTELE